MWYSRLTKDRDTFYSLISSHRLNNNVLQIEIKSGFVDWNGHGGNHFNTASITIICLLHNTYLSCMIVRSEGWIPILEILTAFFILYMIFSYIFHFIKICLPGYCYLSLFKIPMSQVLLILQYNERNKL